MRVSKLAATPSRPILILIGRAIAIVITRVGERQVELRVQAPKSLTLTVEAVDEYISRKSVDLAIEACAALEKPPIERIAAAVL